MARQGYIQDTFVQDILWTMTELCTGQNTGHHTLGNHIFKQGQRQDIKQFGVDRGQREMAKIGDMEIDNSHDNGDMDQ